MDIPEEHRKALHDAWCEHEAALDQVTAARNDLQSAQWGALKAMKLSPRRHGIAFDGKGIPQVVERPKE